MPEPGQQRRAPRGLASSPRDTDRLENTPSASASAPRTKPTLGRLVAFGPGLLVMLADTDIGNVVTSAQAGATWRYRLLSLLLALIPVLYMVQELTVRLGVATGRGFGDLIAERFGRTGAALSLAALWVAVVSSLVTEFTGVAAVGDLYAVPRAVSLAVAAVAVLAVVGTGSYRRVERTAIAAGAFMLAFFVVAWAAHPDWSVVARQAVDLPLGDRGFLYLAAAIIGAVFNPWMIFYQQSAVAEKKLGLQELGAARFDTALGAALTQCLTAAILVAVAATLHGGGSGGLGSIGQISATLATVLGDTIGRAVFSVGVLSAALVATIVCSLALAWGIGELTGNRHVLEGRPFAAGWFPLIYAVAVIGSAALVGCVPDLVWLNVAAQVLNTLLLPVVLGFLVVLAITVLPEGLRPGIPYRWLVAITCTIVVVAGLYGAAAGLMP